MNEIAGGSPFDRIRREDERGEYWLARELQPVMQYVQWRDFAVVVEKAKTSLALVQGEEVAARNFVETRKVSGARGPAGADYRLTRFAAYLVAMAGDDTKPAVAEARIYFAVRAREAEVAPSRALSPRQLAELVIAEADRADRAEAHVAELMPRAEAFAAIEAGDGITLRAFHKKYFSDVKERAFFEHLYRKGYLIDQRGKGTWSERRQAFRNGSQHGHPSHTGKPFLYLHGSVDRTEVRREHPRVRPGEPELAFRARLIRDGLPPNQAALAA
jgi:hypothetical protein